MIKPNWDKAKKILNKKYPKLKIEEINCDNFDEKKHLFYRMELKSR